MTRFISFLFLCLTVTLPAFAQLATDAGGSNGGYGARFNIGLSYGHDWKQSVSDSYSARFSYEFLRTKHFSLIAGARYVLSESSFSPADISYGYNPEAIGMNGSHSTGQAGLTVIYRSRLFNRPFFAVAITNSDWGAGGFARVSSIVTGMIMLRADKDTQFGIGPLFLINTNGKIPALLAFLYRHRFNEKWLINLSGGLFAMEYSPSAKDVLSMGLDIDAKSFYFRPRAAGLPDKLRYMSVAFRPLLKYSRRIVKGLHIDARAGVSVNIVNRINGMTGTRKYLECHQQRAYPFVQAGASYFF